MNCERWHRLMALDVSGDLDPRRSRRLRRHLEGCASCRDLSEELQSQREELLRLDSMAASDVELGSVRGSVLADLGERRGSIFELPAKVRGLAFAGAAAAIVVVVILVLGQRAIPPNPVVAERKTPTTMAVPTKAPSPSPAPSAAVEPLQAVRPPAPVELVESEPLRIARKTFPVPRSKPAVSPPAPAGPMTVKILTDDPDVVIYWIVDPKGEKENA